MFTALVKDIIAANEGSEPERFQFVTEPEPDNTVLEQLFAIDLRALAALRILLGIFCVVFVFQQFAYAELLYTDNGILSRGMNRQMLGDGFWSLMWFSGTYSNARIFLIATGVLAGAFALGYQTRVMNVALLVMLWSVQIRNPLVLTGGDVLLRMLLFWLMFLPTNVVWSIDSWQAEEKNSDHWKVANIATMAIMLQLVYMYFFTGLAKCNAFWLNGDALQYALQLEMSVKPLGRWLMGYPWLTSLATYATLMAELLTVFLLFIPRISHLNRGMMFGFFIALHVGIWLTMSIGLFSITAIVSWLVFIPSDVFNTFFGQPVGFSEQKFHRSPFALSNKLTNVAAGFFLVLVTLQNFAAALPSNVQNMGLNLLSRYTMTVQRFHMFATPPVFSPWFEYNAQLESGQRVDIFYPERGNTVVKPESVYAYMQTQSWRRIHWNLITHPVHPPETELVYREARQRLLSKIVDRWDWANGEDPVFRAQLNCHLDPIVIGPGDQQPNFAHHTEYDLTWAVYEQGSE